MSFNGRQIDNACEIELISSAIVATMAQNVAPKGFVLYDDATAELRSCTDKNQIECVGL